MSVIETIVLLNVAEMWAMPMKTFLLPLALTIFGFSMSFGSSDRLVEIWSAGLTAAGAEAPFLSPPALFSPAGFFSVLGAFSATAAGAPAVTINRLEALEILLQFAAQVAFDDVLVFRNHLDDAIELLIGQALRADIGADLSLFEDQLRAGRPDAVNVRESGFNPFVTGNIDTEKARHI
jgi:hypothetical protein